MWCNFGRILKDAFRVFFKQTLPAEPPPGGGALKVSGFGLRCAAGSQVLGLRFEIPGFGFRVSGCGVRGLSSFRPRVSASCLSFRGPHLFQPLASDDRKVRARLQARRARQLSGWAYLIIFNYLILYINDKCTFSSPLLPCGEGAGVGEEAWSLLRQALRRL